MLRKSGVKALSYSELTRVIFEAGGSKGGSYKACLCCVAEGCPGSGGPSWSVGQDSVAAGGQSSSGHFPHSSVIDYWARSTSVR